MFFFNECGMRSGYFNISLSILSSHDLFGYNILLELIHDEFSRKKQNAEFPERIIIFMFLFAYLRRIFAQCWKISQIFCCVYGITGLYNLRQSNDN